MPRDTWPAVRRSLILFAIVGMLVSSPSYARSVARASVAERGIEPIEPAEQPRPDEIAATAPWPRRILDHRVRGVDDVLGHRDQLGAARLGTNLDGAGGFQVVHGDERVGHRLTDRQEPVVSEDERGVVPE